ncbi:hypothetical protein Salat_2131000 [Sesamum alatum]|uniref:Uncharacterized protein n=1 Tax=Sesamum alatum TaxID=300844 RepID=A0AAE2CH31_9LAMI|nr:hypothetical protein Salat_2131000 [Sesamum alatum]
MKMITRMCDQYHLLMPDPLPSIPLPDPHVSPSKFEKIGGCKHRPMMLSPTTVQPHRHLPLLMQPDRPVDLDPMPQPPTPCKGSSISNSSLSISSSNSSTGKQSSVIGKHNPKNTVDNMAHVLQCMHDCDGTRWLKEDSGNGQEKTKDADGRSSGAGEELAMTAVAAARGVGSGWGGGGVGCGSVWKRRGEKWGS